MAKRINLGLIGCGGNMRGAHLPRIRRAAGVRLVAICDPAEAAAEKLIETWGKPLATYADYRKMLARESLDAVMISTPHNQHYPQARLALQSGCHVLAEKPLVIRPAHARALLKLAGQKRRILHVSYQRHHMAAFRHIRNMLAGGALGTIRALLGYVTQNWGGIGGWRRDPVLSGGGMFMDTGSHLVGASLFLTGLEPREVTAVIDNAGTQVDINASVNIRFRGGAVGSLSTIGNASRHDERIAIHGSDGCIVIHQHGWRLRDVLHNGEPLKIPASVKEDSPDAAFFRWIRGGKGYELPHYALEVARLSEAAYKSARLGRTVKLGR